MSTFVQLLVLFDLVAFSAAKAAEIELSSTVTDSIDSDLSNSDSDWKEFDQEMQEMQNQINACPSWTKFASSNINQNGLYCQKNGQNYKCSSTPAGLSGISVGGCPANLKVKRQLKAKKHKKHSDDSDDSDDWVKQMENEMGEMQNQINACPSWTKASKNLNKKGLYCQKNGQNYKCASKPAGFDGISVGSCPANLKVQRQLKANKDSDDSSSDAQEWKEFDKEMQEMQNQINACPSWTKFASSNINQNGLYCQQNGQNYKCSSTPAGLSGISVGGCPANLKVKRQLRGSAKKHKKDSDDSDDSDDSGDRIHACPSWTKSSNNINQNGLYCQKNGQNYKCTSTPAGLNGIDLFGCPANLKVQRQLKADKDSDDSSSDAQEWKEFDKEMQEMQNQINACPSWTKFASSSISENGLYCQKNDQNYKCSSSSATNGISVGGCPANLKVDRQLDDSNEWKEFDQQMQQLDNKMQEMQNQINACPSWTKFASSSISENGLYCQQNGENYKCSSTPAGLNGISVGGCPENLNTSNVVMI